MPPPCVRNAQGRRNDAMQPRRLRPVKGDRRFWRATAMRRTSTCNNARVHSIQSTTYAANARSATACVQGPCQNKCDKQM
eukprot:13173666-Alexandrium_andersonii.AAC.1